MSRVLIVPVVATALLLTGCPNRYQIHLYNFSGAEIRSSLFLGDNILDPGEYAILYDGKRGWNVLLPVELRLMVGEQRKCFLLRRINEGGYGEINDAGQQIARFKLADDGRVYVYSVAGPSFNPLGSPGRQPNGYPASPSHCR